MTALTPKELSIDIAEVIGQVYYIKSKRKSQSAASCEFGEKILLDTKAYICYNIFNPKTDQTGAKRSESGYFCNSGISARRTVGKTSCPVGVFFTKKWKST